MDSKPVLLIYTAQWSEKRNLLFSRYLSDYFEVEILTILNLNKNVLELIKPVKVRYESFLFKK